MYIYNQNKCFLNSTIYYLESFLENSQSAEPFIHLQFSFKNVLSVLYSRTDILCAAWGDIFIDLEQRFINNR